MPRCGAIAVRLATPVDIPFIDDLQKKHQKMLGWTPRKTIEGKIGAGHVLVAETEVVSCQLPVASAERASSLTTNNYQLTTPATPVGYCISQDRYMGRDDCGVVYQLNVAPVEQRKLIGATLVKTVFERAAYGCRLFCCWCAQDIAANYFWESMGFVPLAFRAGNRAKARVHIFWQRRIREGDVTTPYWFPAETRGGMMNEARLVLPIPPGTHWKDAKPIVLPGVAENPKLQAPNPKQIQNPKSKIQKGKAPIVLPQQSAECSVLSAESQSKAKRALPGKRDSAQHSAPSTQHSIAQGPPPGKVAIVVGGKIRYIDRPGYVAPPAAEVPAVKPKRPPRPKAKNDPRHVAAARELRDRWMEEVNSGRYLPEMQGKYDVSRMMGEMRNAECGMRNEIPALHSAFSIPHSALPAPAAA